jgi:hypothetical protein
MSVLLSLASILLWLSGVTVTAAASPSGHWEGTLAAQFGTVRIELDLATSPDGKPAATFSVPERHLIGLPMLSLSIDGNTIAFEPAAIGARFKGDVSADGTEMTGLFEASAGSLPLTLTRTGDAHVITAPKNAAVSKGFEGTWNGTLHVDGGKRLVLTMQNQADHTATANIVSVDEAGLSLPVAVVVDGTSIAVQIPAVSSHYTGALSADGQELSGTFTTADEYEIPLTFRRGPASAAKK